MSDVTRELSGETAPGSCDSGAHGARWDVEDIGDLGIVKPGHVPEDERFPEVVGQLGQSVRQLVPVGQALIEGSVAVDDGLQVGKAGGGTTRAPAQLVEAGVGGNAVHPRRETGAPLEAIDTAGNGDQGLLGGVHRIGFVAGNPTAYRVDPIDLPAQETIHGVAIAGLGGLDQIALGLGGHDRGRVSAGSDASMGPRLGRVPTFSGLPPVRR